MMLAARSMQYVSLLLAMCCWGAIGIIVGRTRATLTPERTVNSTVVSLGLTEIAKALPTNTLLVYNPASSPSSSSANNIGLPIERFLRTAHDGGLKTCVFTNVDEYFEHLLASESRSEETTTLIVDSPAEIVQEVNTNMLFVT